MTIGLNISQRSHISQDLFPHPVETGVSFGEKQIRKQLHFFFWQSNDLIWIHIPQGPNSVKASEMHVSLRWTYRNITTWPSVWIRKETPTYLYTPFQLTIWAICAFRVLKPLQWISHNDLTPSKVSSIILQQRMRYLHHFSEKEGKEILMTPAMAITYMSHVS